MADEKKRSKLIVEEVVDEPKTEEVTKEATSEEQTELTVGVKEAQVSPDENEPTQSNDASNQTEEVIEKSSPETKPEQKTNFKLVIILTAFIALVLGGVVGGVLVFVSGVTPETVEEDSGAPVPTSTPAPSATPEATEVDRTEYTINIQNGSGIAGEGGRMSTLLTSEEFEIGTVGNASSYDYEETVIQAKEDVSEAFLDELAEVLGETYVLAEHEELPASSSADINIIVGSEKVE